MANLIDIEHLSKSYGKNKVLEDISVSFEGQYHRAARPERQRENLAD